MPTLAATLTSISTPAHTFRATKSTNADVRVESDEVIATASLPVADGGSDTPVRVELAFPNAGAEVVGVCLGGEAPMIAEFFTSADASLGTLEFGGGSADTVVGGLGDFVWPSYGGHAAPSVAPQNLAALLGSGDVDYINVKRVGASVRGSDDASTYPDPLAIRIAIFYNNI